ncbi:MAG: hypothetical protein KCHDKBKB_00587 [Elusimicrobia bacterium]|nr:hypothetical protein [Elusimicrobiota bacterium]
MNKRFQVLLGLFISIVCLWFVFRGFDFRELAHIIQTASYIWFLPVALIFSLNFLGRSIRWTLLLSSIKILPLRVTTPILLIGFFMNNVLPARGGELVRAVTLSRKVGLPIGSILGSIVLERLTDMVGLMVIVMIASKLLPWSQLPIKTIGSIFGIGILVCFIFFRISQKFKSMPDKAPLLVQKILTIFHQVIIGFSALGSFSKISKVVFLSLAIWFGELFIVFFMSRSVQLDLNFFESASLITGLSVGVMIPAAPGFVGTFEFFGKSVLVLLGKPEPTALAMVLLLHFFQMVMMACLALPSFLILSKTTKE